MRTALGALLLVLVSACSGGDGKPSSEPSREPSSQRSPSTGGSTTDAPEEPAKPAHQRLKAAQLALSRATSGAYDFASGVRGLDDPLVSEQGRFDILHEVLEVERTVQVDGPSGNQPKSYVIRIRSSPETRFLQMEDWGPWDDCWAEFTPELMAEIGVDISGVPNIPVPVSLVLDARLVPQNQPASYERDRRPSIVPAASTRAEDSVTVHTDGVTALQMLGMGGTALFELDDAVARVKVPVTITFFERYPDLVEQVQVDGATVASALRSADAELGRRLMSYVGAAWGSAVFSRDVIPVEFVRPAPDRLLPPGATRDQTCPASLD